MPRIPTIRRRTGQGLPAGTPRTGRLGAPVAREPNVPSPGAPTAAGAVEQAAQAAGQLSDQMFEQAVTVERQQLETQAIERFAELENEAIQSENFREAPETFREQAREEARNLVEEANPTIRAELRTSLGRRIVSSTAELRRDAARKSQQEANDAFNNAEDALSSEYAQGRNPVERQQAIESLKQYRDRLVASGAESQEAADERFRQARATFDVERANALMIDGRLDDAEGFVKDSDHIASSNKRVLLDRIKARRDDAGERFEDAARDAIDFIAKTGRTPDNVGTMSYGAIKAGVKGTEVGKELDTVEGIAGDVQQHIQQPLQDQQDALDDMDPGDPTELARKEALQKATQAQIDAWDDGEALDYAERQGLINPLPDLDFEDQGSASFGLALRERRLAAKNLKDHFGATPVPLTAQEQAQLRGIISRGDSTIVQQTFASLNDGLGKKMTQRLAGQFAEDNPDRAVAMYMSADRPEVSRTILEADGATDEVDVKLTPSKTREVIEDTYGSAFEADLGSQEAFVDAAKNVYAQWSVRAGDTAEFNDRRFEKALRFVAMGKLDNEGNVTGGPLELNGKRTLPAKPGMSSDSMQALVNGLDASALEQHSNGTPVFRDANGELTEVDVEDLKDAQFVFAGDGQYTVRLRDEARGGLQAAQGGQLMAEPFLINLEGLANAGVGRTAPQPDQPDVSPRGTTLDRIQEENQ